MGARRELEGLRGEIRSIATGAAMQAGTYRGLFAGSALHEIRSAVDSLAEERDLAVAKRVEQSKKVSDLKAEFDDQKSSRVAELEQENRDLRFLLASTKPREDMALTVTMTREATERHHRHANERDYRIRYDDVTGETTIRYAPKDQFTDPRKKENT